MIGVSDTSISNAGFPEIFMILTFIDALADGYKY